MGGIFGKRSPSPDGKSPMWQKEGGECWCALLFRGTLLLGIASRDQMPKLDLETRASFKRVLNFGRALTCRQTSNAASERSGRIDRIPTSAFARLQDSVRILHAFIGQGMAKCPVTMCSLDATSPATPRRRAISRTATISACERALWAAPIGAALHLWFLQLFAAWDERVLLSVFVCVCVVLCSCMCLEKHMIGAKRHHMHSELCSLHAPDMCYSGALSSAKPLKIVLGQGTTPLPAQSW